jgi:MFS family permease
MPEPAAERLLRRNFAFDAVGALGTGLFNALVVNFLSVIARREGADPLLLAALAAAPFAANTLAIFFGFWVPAERQRVSYVSLLLIVGRAMFLGGLFVTGPAALLAMGLGMWLTMAMLSPLQVDIWRGAYPQRLRARVLGYLRVLQTSAGAVGAPLGGMLIERLGHGPMLGIGAALGMLGAAGVSRVRTEPVAASQRFTPVSSLRLLAEQPRYRRLVVAWVIWGFGSFMATPLYALVLVDRFQASYSDIGFLQLAGALSGLLAYFVLGHYLDRKGGFGATPLGLLMVGLVPLVYLLAPSLPFLAIGYILLSVGNSASDLGWQVALVSRVSDEHRLRYQAAHTSLTGLRGAAAPFVGSLILGLGFGIMPVLVISGMVGILGAGMMARALGIGLVPDLGVLRAVLGNRGRPGQDVRIRHRVVSQRPSVVVAPTLRVDQVLLPRQEGPAADALAGPRSAGLDGEPAGQLVQYPVWQAVPLARVDKPEDEQMTQQHTPVRAETA